MHAEPTYQEAEALDARIQEMEDHTGYGHEVDAYIRNCMAALPSLLRGDAGPPSSSSRRERPMSPWGRTGTTLSAATSTTSSPAQSPHSQKTAPPVPPLRILEVGAGVGGTSTAVLELLEGTDTQYLFTDVSTFFPHPSAGDLRPRAPA